MGPASPDDLEHTMAAVPSAAVTPSEVRAVLGRARRRAASELGLLAFRRRHLAALGHGPEVATGVALLAGLSHSVFQAKLLGMFAKALQLEGLEPVGVMLDGAEFPRRYLEVFGIRRFVTTVDYLPANADEAAAEQAEALLAPLDSAAELKDVTVHGVNVGRQALSTVSRHLHDGEVDLRDPETREATRRFLALGIRSTLAARALLDDLAPDLVLFNERNYALEGPLSDIALARGLNVIQFVSGFEDDALVFKRYTEATRGLHPRSLSDESWRVVAGMPWTERHDKELEEDFARRYDGSTFLMRGNQGGTRARPADELARTLGLDPGRKTAVLFSHVLWDANMFYGRDLFGDQQEWFVETIRAACRNDRVNWVVKLHPANVWKLRRDDFRGELAELEAIRERVGELPTHVRLLEPDTDISTWSLFGVTDYGLTIRGSVGFELPCFGVPVLTAGTGFYSGRGFTVDSESREEYLERLRTIDALPPLSPEQVTLARKHAYALFRFRQLPFTSFRTIYPPAEERDVAEPDLAITVSTLEEAQDLRSLGEWAVRSRTLDFLRTPAR
jgi:hypothetical protein